jgi:regulator of RNase E activity RraA
VVVLPRELEDRILEVAEQIHEAEEAIRKLVAEGATITEARARMNYHKLQTAKS